MGVLNIRDKIMPIFPMHRQTSTWHTTDHNFLPFKAEHASSLLSQLTGTTSPPSQFCK